MLYPRIRHFRRMEKIMTQTVSHFEELITQLRPMLPRNTALAQAIDRREPRERIAMKAIDDSHTEIADGVVRLVEACVRHSTR
jgi:hypothetical protein